MAKTETFKVSKKGVEGVTCTITVPESLSDKAWESLVSNVEEDVNSLALQALIVKVQAAARAHLDEGQEAVQAVVDGYKFRAGGGGFRRPTLEKKTVKNLKFSEEQLAALRAAGVKLES